MEGSTSFFDPFGAPEHLIAGLHRELIGSELIRLSCFALEGNDRILKVRLLLPLQVALTEREKMRAFLESLRARSPLRLM